MIEDLYDLPDAERGKRDHMFLACSILEGTGVADFQPNPHAELFQEFLPKNPAVPLNDLDTQTKKRMVLWPRGVFKTSAVVVDIIQTILCYPNVRIGLLSGSIQVAKDQLSRVKSAFEDPTERFERTYPAFCGRNLGNQSRFTVPNRTLKMIAQPTLMVTTAKSVKAGTHFDVLYVDDLVNDQNYQSPATLEKCWQDYLAVGPLLDPAGYLFVTGTPYNFGDTYERIEERAQEEMRQTGRTVWKFSKRTCSLPSVTEIKPETDKSTVQLLFPQAKTKDNRTIGHTVDYLISELIEKGTDFYSCQYDCTRLAKGMQTFTDELLDLHTLYHFEKPMQESELERIANEIRILTSQGKTFDEALEMIAKKPGKGEIPLGGWTFIMGDLSYVGDERNGDKRDKSVFLVVRVVNGRLYVIACHAGKWKSGEVAEQVIFLLLKYRPKMIWCEAFLGWEAYDTIIWMMAAQRGIKNLPLEWIPLNNQPEAKVVRIGSTHAWFWRDKLYIFAGIEGYQELRGNLKKWPKLGRHDDYGDCLGLAVNAPHGVALLVAHKNSPTMAEKVKDLLYPNGMPYAEQFREKENYPQGNGCGSAIVS